MELRSATGNHARRNLFGPVDHDRLQQDFQSMLCAGMKKAKERWNFDFLQDIPAEGLLQWEELQNYEVPAFYHTCVVGQTCKPMNWDVGKESKRHHLGEVLEKPRPVKKMAKKKSLARKRQRQTSLTDYYTTKKEIRMDMQTPVKKMALENEGSCNESSYKSVEKRCPKIIEDF